jgi:hypothetical protein
VDLEHGAPGGHRLLVDGGRRLALGLRRLAEQIEKRKAAREVYLRPIGLGAVLAAINCLDNSRNGNSRFGENLL